MCVIVVLLSCCSQFHTIFFKSPYALWIHTITETYYLHTMCVCGSVKWVEKHIPMDFHWDPQPPRDLCSIEAVMQRKNVAHFQLTSLHTRCTKKLWWLQPRGKAIIPMHNYCTQLIYNQRVLDFKPDIADENLCFWADSKRWCFNWPAA